MKTVAFSSCKPGSKPSSKEINERMRQVDDVSLDPGFRRDDRKG